jgi:uncharacterized protein YukE
MTIKITLPGAWDAFRSEANKKDSTRNDQCWDVVGDPLNTPVRHVVASYYEKLELGDKNIAMSKRGEILDLHWGRIEQDAAALTGLGKALENLSAVIDANVGAVSAQWSGDSFDAFRTAMDKVRTTLDAYAAGATKVGGILLEAMTQARSMYQDYANATEQTLSFREMSPPEQWHKMDERTGEHLANVCVSGRDLDGWDLCKKNDGEVAPILKGHFATSHQLSVCEAEPCLYDLDRVRIMYDNLVKAGKEGREKIRGIVRDWCGATDDFKDSVTDILKVAVDNVHALAQSQAFSGLRVVGAAGGGQPAPGGGDTGGYPGGDTAGGGYPDSGTRPESIVEPTTTSEPEPAEPEPAPEQTPDTAVDPQAEATDPAADAGTVTIDDGDRTIGVSDAGEGHVTVTVTNASGATRTYDLDFDAASGLSRSTDGEPAPEGVEQVSARTDGKCVMRDGDVTITAERALFAPDQITLTVDDGTGKPTTYTVDFPDTGDEQPGTRSSDTDTDPVAGTETNGSPVPAAPAGTSTEVGAVPAAPGERAPDATAGSPGDAQPTATPLVTGDQVTSPQAAWSEDARGSVSGVLSPHQSDGEAVLAAAPDDAQHDASGMVGGGLPMIGHPGGGTGDGGRAGSGWSVHGDLFDSGEPVYSMHGVLRNDDYERTDR